VVSEQVAERAPVTRAAIVETALTLLAEGGLEAVSFRRIARALGVSGPTLYWHVESKRQLMDLMAEELIRRTGRAYAGPRPDEPWWEWLRADARRMFEALIATRDAPRVLAGNRPSPEAFPDIERVLGVLVDAGMSAGDAQQALFTIGAYVIGSATEWQAEAERATAQPPPDPADEELNALRASVLSRQPLLLQAVTERLEQPHTAAFDFGLDLLIEGLRARVADRGGHRGVAGVLRGHEHRTPPRRTR
jgi:TetR/AcrR family tetracycline transcriptional repressor